LEKQKRKKEAIDIVDTSSVGGDWLSAKNMKIGDRVKVQVVSEGEINPATDDFDTNLTLDIKFENQPKKMRVNKTNVTAIRNKYGKDSKDWVGKELEFTVYRTNFESKLGFQFVG
jgi:hypothetical protein